MPAPAWSAAPPRPSASTRRYVGARLGDRVCRWITLNEPWVIAGWVTATASMRRGGRQRPDAVAAAHHVLLAHGLATAALRGESAAALVGVSVDLETSQAATQTPEDVAAARAFDGHRNRWFLDPIFRGAYPADVQAQLGADGPPVREGDMEPIRPDRLPRRQYYQRRVVAEGNGPGWQFVRQDEATHTDIGWEVSPDGLFELLQWLRDEYAPPAILITENGAAFTDVRGHDAAVRDPGARRLHRRPCRGPGASRRRRRPGRRLLRLDVDGQLRVVARVRHRFGLVYVDFATLERVPKSSFHWYREFLSGVRNGHPRSRQLNVTSTAEPRLGLMLWTVRA